MLLQPNFVDDCNFPRGFQRLDKYISSIKNIYKYTCLSKLYDFQNNILYVCFKEDDFSKK